LFEQAACEVLPDLRRVEIEFPRLRGRNQPGPEDRPATEVELRLLADVVLRSLVVGLPERYRLA
jgi:hypothetical protein